MSIRVVYGLHGFNLASGGLLMSFCGSQTVTFSGIKNAKVVNISHLLGVLVLWKSRYCHVYPLRQNHDPGTLLFNCSSCLCIPSIPWLATVWTCPLELRGHRGWSLYCTNKKWETWKGFHDQEPHIVLLGFRGGIKFFIFGIKNLRQIWQDSDKPRSWWPDLI